MMELIEKLFNPVGLISFVFVMTVLFLLVQELQESPLGQNKDANTSLTNTNSALGTLFDGYFIIDSILGIITIAGVGIYIYKRYLE